MSVHKRNHRGRTEWYYQLKLKLHDDKIRKYGFVTKKEAQDAEAIARAEETKKRGLANPSEQPPTLDVMLENFFTLHCTGADSLSKTTTERYRELKTYLDPDLLAMRPQDISNTRWSAEWKRLLASGGRTRLDKTPRPLSARTVRHIAGMVSSAYTWATHQDWGISNNPVRNSQRPKVRKRRAVTVASADLDLILAAGTGDSTFWCRPQYLAAADALGSRRGELLALRWSDRQNGRFHISRNLIQFDDDETGERRLEFKSTKEDEEHDVSIPASLEPVLEELRQRQNEFKRRIGPEYQDNDLVFCQEDGRPFWPAVVSGSISQLCRTLKLPKGTSLHSLRHTHASVLLRKGVPVATVSKRLGHSSIRTTLDIYGHVLRDEDDQAAAAYDEYRFRERTKQGENHADRVQ